MNFLFLNNIYLILRTIKLGLEMKETDYPRIYVNFDENTITINFKPDIEDEPWSKAISWNDIVQICFKSYDYGAPHFLYIKIKNSDEKFIIGITDQGGTQLWKEIQRRGLVSVNKAKIVESTWNEYNCWPE